MKVQSPDIPRAYARALALDGAGSFAMDAEQGIVPVCIVADATPGKQQTFVDFSVQVPCLAVAAQYGYAQLTFIGAGSPQVERVEVRRVRSYVGAATRARLGQMLTSAGVNGNVYAMVQNQAVTALPGVVRGTAFNSALVPTANEYFAVTGIGAAGVMEVDLTATPFVMLRPDLGNALTFVLDTVNLAHDVTFSGRLYYRGTA